MKKIYVCLIFSLIINFCSYLTILAAGNVTTSVTYDFSTNQMMVSGIVEGTRDNIPLALRIEDENGSFIAGFQTTALRNNEGKIVFAFEPISFSGDFQGGEYKFFVSGHFITYSQPVLYDYFSVRDMYGLLKSVQQIITEDSSGLYDMILPVAAVMSLSKTEMRDLNRNPQAQSVFEKIIKQCSYSLPQSCATAEDFKATVSAFQLFAVHCADALSIASFNNFSSIELLQQWLDKYYIAYGFSVDDAVTPVNEELMTEYVERVKDKSEFYDRISLENSAESIDKIKDVICESALLTAIHLLPMSFTPSIYRDFPTVFTINQYNRGKLTAAEHNKAYEAVANKYFASYSEAIVAYDNKVRDLIDVKTDSNNTSPGSGGKGNGSNIIISDTTPVQKPDDLSEENASQQEINILFNDIDSVSWAKDAILHLAERGIVNGKSEDMFAPDDFVTRAEFAKMIALTGNLILKNIYAENFYDVQESDWAYPYIMLLNEKGIVQGDSNLFYPNDYISRQDMAVMLGRCLNITGGEKTSSKFSDNNMISDYAVRYVVYFANKGMIKGVSEEIFDPKGNATRAQAAVMLHNILFKN